MSPVEAARFFTTPQVREVAMNRNTAALVRELTGCTKDIPLAVTSLLANKLSAAAQRDLADQLATTAELLRTHANEQEIWNMPKPAPEKQGD
ncbi:hypothetical protein [Amycolatopsis sp. NPDC051071]|uniref:hypothetical protein n=1 Tax=Amycolatopsis sp. NPDC051071 TaxID=3154637 RepID=UPI003447F37F